MNNQYSTVLLDSCFFDSCFTADEKKFLLDVSQIFVSRTSDTERNQIRILLDEKRRDNFEYNNRILQNLKLIPITEDEMKKNSEKTYTDDLWGIIRFISDWCAGEKNHRVLVFSENKLLIQRVITSCIDIDVYDFSTKKIIYFETFHNESLKYSFKDIETPAYYDEIKIEPGALFYLGNGRTIKIDSIVGQGKEAAICSLDGEPGYIAKLFWNIRDGRSGLNIGKKENIENQVKNRIDDTVNCDWACFPREIVYSNPKLTRVAGFIEKSRPFKRMSKDRMFMGDILDIDYVDKKGNIISQSDVVSLCLSFVRQVYLLNHYGFYISDYNTTNFAYRESMSDNIQMWDTDSFGYESYFSRMSNGAFHKYIYEINTLSNAADYCRESLFLFVFSLLSLGDKESIDPKSHLFHYIDPEHSQLYRKDFFPGDIWDYFYSVFTDGAEMSTEVLMERLSQCLSDLEKGCLHNKSYKELIAPYCENDEEEQQDEWLNATDAYETQPEKFTVTIEGETEPEVTTSVKSTEASLRQNSEGKGGEKKRGNREKKRKTIIFFISLFVAAFFVTFVSEYILNNYYDELPLFVQSSVEWLETQLGIQNEDDVLELSEPLVADGYYFKLYENDVSIPIGESYKICFEYSGSSNSDSFYFKYPQDSEVESTIEETAESDKFYLVLKPVDECDNIYKYSIVVKCGEELTDVVVFTIHIVSN